MLCERCNTNKATTQITRISNQGTTTENLCEVCAARQRGASFSPRYSPFSSFEGSDPFFSIDESQPSRQPRHESVNVMDYFTNRANTVLQTAAQRAVSLKHRLVDTEHFLWALAEEKEVAQKLLTELGVKPDDLANYLKAISPEGAYTGSQPELSPRAKRVLQLAFDEARSLNHNYVGSEHILLALIREGEGLAAQTLEKFAIDLTKARAAVIKLVGEGIADGEQAKQPSKTPTLDEFSQDLTLQAREGKIDPVIGRQHEIDRVIHILSRRTKNNPVLIGEPGVGKTAIVEGLATRIVQNEVPEALQNKRLLSLDLAGMVAGTKYRGEFEERLKKAVDEVRQASREVILFIDELHTLVGAGGAEGAIDAANLLKPALARGELQAIGATTLSEYKKHIEKDAALERRFQPVIVKENSVEETIEILRGLRDRYEAHHRVKISDEALVAAAELSDRYVQDRFLPDKAIDLIDEASAEVRLQSVAPPANLQEVEAQMQRISKELESAGRNKEKDTKAKLEQELEELQKTHQEIKEVWEKQKGTDYPVVTVDNVASVLSRMTGIPVTKLTEEERSRLLDLEAKLHKKIVGQDKAVSLVADAVRRARAGLKDPRRPIGVFMFLGPTGVGKTELARVLAEELYGSEDIMIRLDMSEYQERHTVARLIGSPPGYVGFDEGGQLTEKVRRQPFSIILLDEIEKAHPDIFNLLLQIMEDGRLTDGKGRTVDFKNTIVIMTSNLGSRIIQDAQTEGMSDGSLEEKIEDLLKAQFKPEFINRIDEFILFQSLTPEDLLHIVDLQLEEVRRLVKAQDMELSVDAKVKKHLAEIGYEAEYGARPLRRVIQTELETPLSQQLIKQEFVPGDTIKVSFDTKNKDLAFSKAK